MLKYECLLNIRKKKKRENARFFQINIYITCMRIILKYFTIKKCDLVV